MSTARATEMLTRLQWLLVVGAGAAVAVVTWTLLTVGQHLWVDHQDHHVVLELLRLNVAAGRLLPLGAPSPSQPQGPPPPPEKKP